jgi:hypothetical protein
MLSSPHESLAAGYSLHVEAETVGMLASLHESLAAGYSLDDQSEISKALQNP